MITVYQISSKKKQKTHRFLFLIIAEKKQTKRVWDSLLDYAHEVIINYITSANQRAIWRFAGLKMLCFIFATVQQCKLSMQTMLAMVSLTYLTKHLLYQSHHNFYRVSYSYSRPLHSSYTSHFLANLILKNLEGIFFSLKIFSLTLEVLPQSLAP